MALLNASRGIRYPDCIIIDYITKINNNNVTDAFSWNTAYAITHKVYNFLGQIYLLTELI